jgi:hypothetical protein
VRVRPAWDIILILLMLGGSVVSATGLYVAVRRVRSDLITLYRAVTGSTGIARRHAAVIPIRLSATEVTRWGSPPLASPPALCT